LLIAISQKRQKSALMVTKELYEGKPKRRLVSPVYALDSSFFGISNSSKSSKSCIYNALGSAEIYLAKCRFHEPCFDASLKNIGSTANPETPSLPRKVHQTQGGKNAIHDHC
jgi:hypothetical protein